jgi:hypothetical protein
MEYTLMHREIAVAELTIDETVAAVTNIGEVYRPEHIPVGITVNAGRPERKALHDRWIGRSIPASRLGLRDAWEIMHVSSPQFLLTKCYGLSLSDQYWLKPANKEIAWTDINFFDNSLTWDGDRPFSVCEDFVTKNTDIVSAWHIRVTGKKAGHVSEYRHFLNCCESLGIPGAQASIDRMLTVDFIIANQDRHFNNFGALRNAETLEWAGLAPVFDCGTSLEMRSR